MLYFPASLEKSFGFEMSPGAGWKTLYSEAYGGGAVQTQPVWPSARHRFTGPTFFLQRSDRKILRQFFEALNGRANPCYFFYPDSWEFDLLKVGTTSGSAGQVIDMRLKESSISSVVISGVSRAFTFAAGAGVGGEDRITITSSFGAGIPIYVAGYGRLRFKARLTSAESIAEAWWSAVQQPYADTAFEFEEEFEIF